MPLVLLSLRADAAQNPETYTGAMETERPLWRSRAWPVAAVMLLCFGAVLGTVASGGQRGRVIVAVVALTTVVAVVVATALRVRAERASFERELAAWATERAAHTERLRIAGELHDIVSHGIGLVTIRAAAAQSVTGPAAAIEHATALADIERTSRETTAELRRMLTVLREPGLAPLRPADSFADLPAIIATAEAAGLTVEVDGIGTEAGARADELGTASAGAQLTACAVVREALNNAFRHAGPTAARVGIHRDGGAVVVRVSDEGPRGAWQPEPGAGRGLQTLRERLAVHGGTLEAGAHGRGFLVVARIPDGQPDA